MFDRAALVRRGLRLNWLSLGYNALEGAASLIVGFLTRSLALKGFGWDSLIELAAAAAAQWRLRADWRSGQRERVERATRWVIGVCFLALGAYITTDSVTALWRQERPDESVTGMVVLALSVVVMPLLARAKRRVARAMESGALVSEAKQASLCAYLSAIGLAGVALNAVVGWWWADPVAALVMVPIMVKEGIEGMRAPALDPSRG